MIDLSGKVVNWLVLAVNGVLLSILFRRQLKASRRSQEDGYGATVARTEGP